MEYDAPLSCGSDDTVLKADYDCLLSSQHCSWLHPDAFQITTWVQYITEGTRLPNQVIDGSECVVFEWSQKHGDETFVRHRVYLDRVSMLPVAWHTDSVAAAVRRERTYHVIGIDPPPTPDDWRIRVKEIKEKAGSAPAGVESAPVTTNTTGDRAVKYRPNSS